MSPFNPERGGQQDISPETDKKDQVLNALHAKIEDLRSYGKHGETNIKRYEKLRTEINRGSQEALNEVARELGLEEAEVGEQELESKGKSPKKMSQKDFKRVQDTFDSSRN